VICGSFGASDRFADILRAPKLSLTSFFVIIYTSSQWLDGRIGAKIRPRTAPPKTNYITAGIDTEQGKTIKIGFE
jgi:hypothetical protein